MIAAARHALGSGGLFRRPRRLVSVALAILLVATIATYLAFEGDLLENLVAVRQWLGWALDQYGVGASLTLLYLEESGLPLPVPGDVYVAYIGQAAAGQLPHLIAGWLSIIAVVTAGASNLYLISRRWGPRLIRHPLARAFHVSPERMATASRWFDRWGVLALVFGRHIPGFRVPLTAVAGTVNFPYRKFVPSVAVSTSIWAAFFMLVGNAFGKALTTFLSANTWIYAVGTGVLLLGIIYFGVRVVRIGRGGFESSKY